MRVGGTPADVCRGLTHHDQSDLICMLCVNAINVLLVYYIIASLHAQCPVAMS